MRILRLSAYSFPEAVASNHLIRDLDEAISAKQIYTKVITPCPSRGLSKGEIKKYQKIKKETLSDGFIEIERFSIFKEPKNSIMRAFRYLICFIKTFFKAVRQKNIDIIYSASTPPTQGMLCALVKKRLKIPFVYNLQDIFPDSLVNAKMAKKGGLLWKIGRKIEDFTYKNADKIIVISEDFKQNIMAKGVPEEKIVVIPNWVNSEDVYPVDRKDNVIFDRYNLDRNKFYVCYSGNLGHSQNLELLVEAAKILQKENPDIVFLLIGEGAAKDSLMETVKKEALDNIIILPFQPYEDIAHVFSAGDVGLIISKPGIGGSSVPSKTWSIMAAARPILASFDEDSSLARLINDINCGFVLDAGDKNKLINAIIAMTKLKSYDMGANGYHYVSNIISKEFCVNRYIDTIENLLNK